jgi:hypothetical protein
MYRCIICKKLSERGITQFKIYSYKKNINSEGYEKGFDIASEKKVCKTCYDNEKNKKSDGEVKSKEIKPKAKPREKVKVKTVV